MKLTGVVAVIALLVVMLGGSGAEARPPLSQHKAHLVAELAGAKIARWLPGPRKVETRPCQGGPKFWSCVTTIRGGSTTCTGVMRVWRHEHGQDFWAEIHGLHCETG